MIKCLKKKTRPWCHHLLKQVQWVPVEDLFTCTPVEDSISIIHNLLKQDATLKDRTSLNPEQITDLLSFCLHTTYFVFQGQFYKQKEGAAMGSPVSPIVANLFMEHLENQALSTALNPPKLWIRYVDDTFIILKKDHFDEFTNHINTIHPSIKFTSEVEIEGQLPMLDVLFTRQPDKHLKCKVYRKKTHTDQYLHFDSHHPLQHKLGVIRTLQYRADTLVTEQQDKDQEINHINNALRKCGYQDWVLHTSNKKRFRVNNNNNQQHNNNLERRKSVTLPYIRGVSETLARLYRIKGISTSFKPINTLRNMLVCPKDKCEEDMKSGTIYHVNCSVCDSNYVGESIRALKYRIAEHKRPSNKSSPINIHHKKFKHPIAWDKVEILDQDTDWFGRGVREAIHIRRCQANLNRDSGRHKLPPIYNRLLGVDDSVSPSDGDTES